ncbi:bifunctional enoyl-CoA hydratase/phosphate acetyltransferase [Natranaerobius thermophilus]|uniref:Phosphate butyryltransferase n=1 Tax=Natranaerobius thermophilus (strain ATCC BAA-1301 / DSM 18059 / JW/NM-WN-LF) TaxID=457570 RepID=B2A8M9_NATTJ|nr:bifunctional enoyl-CoA hydratase/phosphate acetyltransferase [Natranaerobius thermophilus]ACB85912.1 phosphate butyryltransferase [Natranaerobius thermophilus JW/NM-WN-LF]
MYKDFSELLASARKMNPVKLSVAAAEDEHVLEAVKQAIKDNLNLEFSLVGDGEKIEKLRQKMGMDQLQAISVIDAKNPRHAAELAVKEVSQGDANYLMKGLVSTKDFLKEVLHQEYGLRTGRTLSHIGAFEIETYPRVFFMTDGGINPNPALEDKEVIIKNSVEFVRALGIKEPKVAVLAAVETVNPKMEATIDGANLAKMQERSQIKGAWIDGPLALDNAIDENAAKHKGITSPVAGKADILLVPDIESGNLLGKSITFLGGGTMAGMVVGAQVPIVLTSRADSVRSKMTSMALGALASQGNA